LPQKKIAAPTEQPQKKIAAPGEPSQKKIASLTDLPQKKIAAQAEPSQKKITTPAPSHTKSCSSIVYTFFFRTEKKSLQFYDDNT